MFVFLSKAVYLKTNESPNVRIHNTLKQDYCGTQNVNCQYKCMHIR